MIAASLTRPVELSDQPAAARRQLARLLADAGWEGDTDAVVLAVHEAMVNSQRHAGGVTCATANLDHGALVVEVVDAGGGFGIPESPDMPDAAAETGRGLYLIRRLAADARVVRSDGEVRLVLRFER
ncbi:MAG TPA: ATP-binding protein [Acidimicrobiales bacterium]|nr:ATP-binding protein [Acidimicrobiales bacterium]